MVFKMLSILLLSLFTFALAAAPSAQDICSVEADNAQNQLRIVAPVLQYAATTFENARSEQGDSSPQVTNYLNAIADALAQINLATGSSSDQFRSEVTRACTASSSNNNNNAKKRGAIQARQVDQGIADFLYTTLTALADALDPVTGDLGELLAQVVGLVLDLLRSVLAGL
ncbi:hypothetical protein BJY01DRAFT_167844 [Aspergillus pseudoustus]|uniref:Hydrophobic surface binding protein A-domain-containing protein n=1 Tax=Aspergillus pseudoustus TaxID=1810923 RepID=A0ABR4I8U5_9EURO